MARIHVPHLSTGHVLLVRLVSEFLEVVFGVDDLELSWLSAPRLTAPSTPGSIGDEGEQLR